MFAKEHKNIQIESLILVLFTWKKVTCYLFWTWYWVYRIVENVRRNGINCHLSVVTFTWILLKYYFRNRKEEYCDWIHLTPQRCLLDFRQTFSTPSLSIWLKLRHMFSQVLFSTASSLLCWSCCISVPSGVPQGLSLIRVFLIVCQI